MNDPGLKAAFEYLHSRADYREGRYWLLDEDIHQLVGAIEKATKPAPTDDSTDFAKAMGKITENLARVAEALAHPPTVMAQPALSHCPGCRCEKQDRAETGLRDRLNLGESIPFGEVIPPHTQYEILMREIRAGSFNTIGKRQARTCTHGVEWEDMSYQHWITSHRGDYP